MILVDPNVLLYAVNADARQHDVARGWLDQALSGDEPIGFADTVMLAFLRIATHPAIFPMPLSIEEACRVMDAWIGSSSAVVPRPADAHAARVCELLAHAGSGGNLVSDAHLKAADDLTLKLQASIVSIACAAMAVEAEVNWQADRHDRTWLDDNDRLWSAPEKWRKWIAHRNGMRYVAVSGLGQRVVNLFNDRNLIVHFHGVPDGKGGLAIHQPPDASNSGITKVRAYFTPELARRHVTTAEEAIAALSLVSGG